MNDIKVLFEEALAGEPAGEIRPDEDIARGRARRRRVMRRRAGGGVLVIAAVAAGLALPSSPVTLVDGEVATDPPAEHEPRDVVLAPEVIDNPIEQEMWAAVDASLPADVELASGSQVAGLGPGPNLYLDLVRGEATFSLSVWLQNARPDLAAYRPCDPSDPQYGRMWSQCSHGTDDHDRWWVVGNVGGDGSVMLEGGTASVAIRWRTNSAVVFDEQGNELAPYDSLLTEAEARTVAAAVWTAGSAHTEDELRSGVDLDATAQAWPDLVAALERNFGFELIPADPDAAVPAVDITDAENQVGTVSATYRTAAGTEVTIGVLQGDRHAQPWCADGLRYCLLYPGTMMQMDDDPTPADASNEGAGQRGGLLVTSDEFGSSMDRVLAEAMDDVLNRVPFLGPEPYPQPPNVR